MTIADFCVGGVYVYYFTNDKVAYSKEEWKACLKKHPNFQKYGERFASDKKMKIVLKNRK